MKLQAGLFFQKLYYWKCLIALTAVCLDLLHAVDVCKMLQFVFMDDL